MLFDMTPSDGDGALILFPGKLQADTQPAAPLLQRKSPSVAVR